MKTKIFYFSATGNCLNVAQKIAAGLEETELVSIPKAMKDRINAAAPKIGLIFPVYAWGLPRIVSEFISKLELHKEQYIFAVAVNGGTPAGTLKELRKTLRCKGVELNAGFAVKEASYAPLGKNPLISFIRSIAGKIPKPSEERLMEIITTVQKNQNHQPETSSWGANLIGGLLHSSAIQAFKNGDKAYWVDDKCNQCGTCGQICPRGNISVKDGKPVWNHDCELCFACLQWCPREAIQYGQGTVQEKRSHHPDVELKDIILR